MVKKTSWSKKKKSIKLTTGKLYVLTTRNNTLVNLTDEAGNKVLGWWTWLIGYKWSKQSTPYAAEMLIKEILGEAKNSFWLKEIGVFFKGVGLWREGVFKGINDMWGIDISYITEQTPIQFGGCRRLRPRRN